MSAYNLRRSPAVDELPLFAKPAPNLAEGLRRKEEGLSRVELSNKDFVDRMRVEAVEIAKRNGHVFIDDVRERAEELGLRPTSSAAWGPIFGERGKWRIVGWKRSEVVSNHGHMSPVRELVEEN